jgi:hypothetical protein
MIDPLIPFNELQSAGYGLSSRALKVLCSRYGVPVVKLNKRQYALRESDYQLLLKRATIRKAA